ncbi:gamma-glutamyl-gamma-aminobutyrate hydrolase family protein, partial [Peribacillus deserti]
GNKEITEKMFSICDGILLSGGEDINPQLFGAEPHPKLGKIIPERDSMEVSIIEFARNKNIPIFAICRGIQILNAALGGTNIQDVESEKENCLKHFQATSSRGDATHLITVEKGSKLNKITGKVELNVNSFHHQAVNEVAPILKPIAVAKDGVIEAVESNDDENHWILGVQWHPEDMTKTDKDMKLLFKAFIGAC